MKATGNILAGTLICWLLNITQLGVAWLLLVLAGEQTLDAFFIMVAAIGLLQIAYVVPIYRLLKRKGLTETAKGVLIAACVTALLNVTCDGMIFGSKLFE